MFSNNKILGVEIGRDEIKAVELKTTGKDQYFISAYASVDISRAILSEGNVIDADGFTEAFVQLIRDNKFSAKTALFGIDNQTTILRFASFPKVAENLQQGLVRLNAQEHLPVHTNDVEIDYIKLGESTDEEGDKINVLLCAIRKKIIQRILGISKAAGITPRIVMPSQIAYVNTVLRRIDYNDFMAVRIGKKSVYHIVFENHGIAFMRYVNLDSASVSILAAISRGQRLLPEENELISAEILKGVNASIDYYRLRNKKEIDKVCFTGASALSQHVSNTFEKELQAHVEYVRLFEPDGRKGSSPPEEYDSCISLALTKY